jgi:hypothetical protein
MYSVAFWELLLTKTLLPAPPTIIGSMALQGPIPKKEGIKAVKNKKG